MIAFRVAYFNDVIGFDSMMRCDVRFCRLLSLGEACTHTQVPALLFSCEDRDPAIGHTAIALNGRWSVSTEFPWR